MTNLDQARSSPDDEDPTAELPVLYLHEVTLTDGTGHEYRARVVIESDLPAPSGTALRAGFDPYNSAETLRVK